MNKNYIGTKPLYLIPRFFVQNIMHFHDLNLLWICLKRVQLKVHGSFKIRRHEFVAICLLVKNDTFDKFHSVTEGLRLGFFIFSVTVNTNYFTNTIFLNFICQ